MLFDTDTEKFTDGVHEGEHIQDVAEVDPGYLLWVISDDCHTPERTKAYIQAWMNNNPDHDWEEVW